MAIPLRDYQLDAIRRLKTGCILNGGVGSGKSRTALAYYYMSQGGVIEEDFTGPMDDPPKDLYIITTARKRDTKEWELEMSPFLLSSNPDVNLYSNKVVVDSWNNITKYIGVKNAFFIFDEQRVVGKGTWVKSFLKITKSNEWILLSGTPGDCWSDYIPVFVANGFYENPTEFNREHVVYSRYTNFPKIDRYVNTKRLIRLRDAILIDMDFHRNTVSHHEDIFCEYDISTYKTIIRDRWNIWDEKPIENAAQLCYALRKVVNSSEDRQSELIKLVYEHPKVIIFYNYDYELEILREICQSLDCEIAEWNGHKHQEIPKGPVWAYLVQYNAGCEGWNCILTDTIIFYSQNYSYKIMEQARGRIDRMNTPYTDLYYYHLKSKASIDLAISKALSEKKKFNEGKFAEGRYR